MGEQRILRGLSSLMAISMVLRNSPLPPTAHAISLAIETSAMALRASEQFSWQSAPIIDTFSVRDCVRVGGRCCSGCGASRVHWGNSCSEETTLSKLDPSSASGSSCRSSLSDDSARLLNVESGGSEKLRGLNLRWWTSRIHKLHRILDHKKGIASFCSSYSASLPIFSGSHALRGATSLPGSRVGFKNIWIQLGLLKRGVHRRDFRVLIRAVSSHLDHSKKENFTGSLELGGMPYQKEKSNNKV